VEALHQRQQGARPLRIRRTVACEAVGQERVPAVAEGGNVEATVAGDGEAVGGPRVMEGLDASVLCEGLSCLWGRWCQRLDAPPFEAKAIDQPGKVGGFGGVGGAEDDVHE